MKNGILTNIVFYSFDVSVQLLQDTSQFSLPSQILETGEGFKTESPAVLVDSLEPQLPAIFQDLLQDRIQHSGVVPVCQL